MEITPLVLTFNEGPNIGRTLDRLTWAKEVVVVDSFSTDETLAIASGYPNVRVVQRPFDSFAAQSNFGLQQIKTKWVLSLDADYILSEELVRELSQLSTTAFSADSPSPNSIGRGIKCEGSESPLSSLPSSSTVAFAARFRYCILGRPLRASLYPARTVLYRKEKARYRNEGHGHRVEIDGLVSLLSGWIDHDDCKPLGRWFGDQVRYATQEAEHIQRTPAAELNLPDRIRKKIIFAPFLVFTYTLFGKGLILDGWPGWYYVMQRTLAEILLSLRLLEQKLKRPKAESRK